MTTATNGHGTATTVLPASIEVNFGAFSLVAPASPTKAGGMKYEASAQAALDDNRSFEEAIAGISPTLNGRPVPVASKYVDEVTGAIIVRSSEPMVRNGRVLPNTGGKPTLSWWTTIDEMGHTGYQLRITAKGVTRSNGRFVTIDVQCVARPAGRGFTPKGSVQGTISL